jgi:hypothetical protein
MSPTTTEKRSVKTDPFYAADKLTHIVHTQNLQLQDVAAYLGMGPSGLTQAMRRRNGLRWHLRKISKFLKVPLSELTGIPNAESQRLLPQEGDPTKPGRRARSDKIPPEAVPLALGEIVGKPTTDGEYALSPGCMLKRIQEGEKGPIIWLLLGPKGADLEMNSQVLVRTKDGRCWFRRYQMDPDKKDFVVLMPTRAGDPPIILHKDEVVWIRIVIGPLRMKGQ